ncbi:MAG: carboxymuconolactone decarboxylase family protein [Caldimonas sp.]
MPRVKQQPLSQAHPRAKDYYKVIFDGRCPVEHPGTESGTPGHWWSTIALRPYIFDHAADHLKMYGFFSPASVSELDKQLREIAITRVGYAVGSQFVYSQHCKALRHVGLDEARIQAIPHWGVSDLWTPVQRAVLAYTDAVVYDLGRVPDGVFSALKSHLSDEDIVELTYHIGGYMQHATFCRALRLEYDDVPERIVEVPVPAGKDLGAFAARHGVDKRK